MANKKNDATVVAKTQVLVAVILGLIGSIVYWGLWLVAFPYVEWYWMLLGYVFVPFAVIIGVIVGRKIIVHSSTDSKQDTPKR